MILLFASGEAAVDREAVSVLSQAGDLDVRAIEQTRALEGRMILPFIQTESGERYFGLLGIRFFVEERLNGSAQA